MLDNIVTTSYRHIRHLYILRRVRLRVRDFLSTKVVLASEPASFWRENVIAIVILTTGFSKNVVLYWWKQVMKIM